MNTPINRDDEVRCAEYALGVLDLDERRALEQAASADPQLQAVMERWQQYFAPLVEDLPPQAVPPRVWLRIRSDLGFRIDQAANETGNQSANRPASESWWNNLALWRWVGAGASVAALALLAVNLTTHVGPQAPTATVASTYMVSTLARADGVAHWTATVDVQNARMVVVPADKPNIAADRATELWLIPPNAKPIPLGVFASDQPASMTLPPAILAQIDTKAVLAVSIEPPGGSPTGQPTGPVVATGAIHPA
ncbi:anti-sigma factor [Pandoraea iniqua]|uniref:anti-sigma factor n=1 Tax=Pandoraea iniqua TaxID=2508288 RepID=UPI001242CBBE|nr:anti-sigma factor [Pandoraea iniqua]VVE04860.1 anti-sigma factor [Pandoraea iniqua]